MTNVSVNENEWPVHVYRKTERSWQKMQPTKLNGKKNAVIKASPRRNCVVLHRIRVRIRLSGVSKSNSNISNASSSPNETDDSNTLVIRRRHCILISSKQKLRSLVLKFSDEKACLEFSDLLVNLNPSPEREILAGLRDETTAYASLRGSELEQGTTQASQQVLSYVGRLLHDEDFASMCDNLEACISASEDGARMLCALVNGSEHIAAQSESGAE